MKKLVALFLAVIMMMTAAAAFAATTLDTNGEQGPFVTKDTPISQDDKTLVLEKELKAFNHDEDTVKAPTIAYSYTVSGATVATGTTVTDSADKHTSNKSVTAPVKQGIGTLTATVSWTTNDELDASSDGEKNVKDITLDFSNIVFTGPGVYRYKITEALASGYTYPNTGVTETDGNHERFIDVYVRPKTPTPSGKTQNDADYWDIYGFTCFYNNESITDGNKTTVAVKTTGFVDGTTGGSSSTDIMADQYYTYNLLITKTVVGDEYAKTNHKFPFSLIFTNDNISKHILLMTTEEGDVTDFTHAAGEPNWTGVAQIKSGGNIKYIGIPVGTDVEVYETNDVTGVTYKVATFINGADSSSDSNAETVDAAVSWGNTPTQGVAQSSPKNAYESTKHTVHTTIDTEVDEDNYYKIEIVNTLLTISPTGVVLRVAPYIMILAAGILLFILGLKRRTKKEGVELIQIHSTGPVLGQFFVFQNHFLFNDVTGFVPKQTD